MIGDSRYSRKGYHCQQAVRRSKTPPKSNIVENEEQEPCPKAPGWKIRVTFNDIRLSEVRARRSCLVVGFVRFDLADFLELRECTEAAQRNCWCSSGGFCCAGSFHLKLLTEASKTDLNCGVFPVLCVLSFLIGCDCILSMELTNIEVENYLFVVENLRGHSPLPC